MYSALFLILGFILLYFGGELLVKGSINIALKANIEIYQVEGDTTGQISVALYPAGAYTATTLQTAIRTLSAAGSNNLDCSTSDVTDPGFELV